MIALVTSTLNPGNAYSSFTPSERLDQTLHTLEKLYEFGFSHVYFFDNSIDTTGLAIIAKNYPDVQICYGSQYTFNNKGLNESLLILNHIHQLPSGQPIFKISARYYPTRDFNFLLYEGLLKSKEIIGIGSHFHGLATACFVTRAYFVKDREFLEDMLLLAVEEMISYSKGVYGIRSFLKALKNIFNPTLGTSYQLSLEQAFARISKKRNSYLLIDKLNIEGYIAGNAQKEFVSE